jgi:hypothetical protein
MGKEGDLYAHGMRNEIYSSNGMAPIHCSSHLGFCNDVPFHSITSKRTIKMRKPIKLAHKYCLLAVSSLRIPWDEPAVRATC